MIIINLPTYLFCLLTVMIFIMGLVIGIGLTSWYVQKELEKSTKN